MEILNLLFKEIPLIANAPISSISLMVVAAYFGYTIARFRFGTITAIANERRSFHEDQVKKLSEEIQSLKSSASSNQNLGELIQRIEDLPKIYVGPTPPPNTPRDGDIWFQTE